MKIKMNTGAIVKNMRKGYLVLQERERLRKMQEMGTTYLQGQFVMPGQVPGSGAGEQGTEKPVSETEGIEIPTKFDVLGKTGLANLKGNDMSQVNVSYRLEPDTSAGKDGIYAYANIKWDKRGGDLLYSVVEPNISQNDKEMIGKVITDLEERLNLDFTKLGIVKAKEMLRNEIMDSFDRIQEINIDPQKKRELTYYIEKEVVGYGKIDALMKDANIEDISCDGLNIPIYIYHRNPKLGSLKTNLVFTKKEELDSFVVKMAQKCNKSISIASPLLDGSLPDGSRIQATLGTDIARKGSNFTIRKFTEKPLTPTHMLKYKTLNSTQLAYLWLSIENGQSILVSGGTATGKTAMLNVLTLFIRPNMKVVSIEDTAELRLPLPHWVPHVARTPISIEGKVGEVSLFDLLKSSLRQRPDYIIVGEVRGKETYVLFQQIATGHTGLATIHAANFSQLIDRLITPPISLPPTLIENINIIIFLVVTKRKGLNVRRAHKIVEVIGMENEKPKTRDIFTWKAVSDSFELTGKSVVLNAVMNRLGIKEQEIKEEISRRKKILEWMLEKEIFDYKDVARVVSTYYSNPNGLIDMIMGG